MGTVAQGVAREKETHLVERADRCEEDDGRRCMREKPNEVSGRCRLKHSTSVLLRETKVEAIRVRPQSGHLALRARIAAGPASDPTYRPPVSDAPARARARDGGGRIGNGPTRSGQDEGTRGGDLTGRGGGSGGEGTDRRQSKAPTRVAVSRDAKIEGGRQEKSQSRLLTAWESSPTHLAPLNTLIVSVTRRRRGKERERTAPPTS